jgi:hypothetical protein
MTLSIKSLAVIAFVGLLVAMTLAVLLVPSASWAAMYEWITTSMTTTPPCACSMAPSN